MIASGLTFAASLSFLALPPVVKNYVILDDLNVFFIILNTLVGFTTSVFSASYIEPRDRDGAPDAAASSASTTPCSRP